MLEYTGNDKLDQIDKAILRILQQQGRISNADLARQVDLSPPATHARVRRLEEAGIITGYNAQLSRSKLGYDMLCFISVSLQVHQHEHVQWFREAVEELPEVLECHHVTGEFDYLLKVVISNREDLERFIVQHLTSFEGVSRIYTRLVIAEVKSSTELPLVNI